jgi:hypothetical protein
VRLDYEECSLERACEIGSSPTHGRSTKQRCTFAPALKGKVKGRRGSENSLLLTFADLG